MANYKEKYLKYKSKYIELKQQKGGSYTHVISLLWFNKKLGPIEQISNGEDLKIKEKIITPFEI
jgi:hypothetical protein